MTADKRAVSRDETLRRLMAEYEIPIRRMCCIYLRDADLAADAVQDTFLKAYLALDQYRGEASEKTWLMRIAVNTWNVICQGENSTHIDIFTFLQCRHPDQPPFFNAIRHKAPAACMKTSSRCSY